MDEVPPKCDKPVVGPRQRLIKDKLGVRLMEFECERDEYSVAEFYRKFGSNLPQVAIVTAGFHGDTFDDVFDRGEVIRIHDVSKQRRVVARGGPPSNLHISIPRSFSQPLCILDKRGKPIRLESINDIVTKYSLPQSVAFPPDSSFSVGTGTVHTNHIGALTLTEVFDEMYLMGNIVTTGVVSQEIVHVPLYLSQLRLSVCTGIKGKTREVWLSYLNGLHLACANIQYKRSFGNPNVAVYDPEVIHAENYESYSYVEPTNYTSFGKIKAQLHRTPKPSSEAETDIYDQIPEPAASKPSSARPSKTPPPTPSKPTYGAMAKAAAMAAVGKKPTGSIPKTVQTIPAEDPYSRPALPDRRGRPPLSYPNIPPPASSAGIVTLENSPYSNDIPRTAVQPLSDDYTRYVTRQPWNTCKDVTVLDVSDRPEAFKSQMTHSNSSFVTKEAESAVVREVRPAFVQDAKQTVDVARLSIDQLGEYLRRLRLEKYVERFSDDMIDGAIVQDLTKEMLKDEYGMRGIELIRLMKFINDGYVPR